MAGCRFVELEQMQVERRLRGQIKSADTVESKVRQMSRSSPSDTLRSLLDVMLTGITCQI